MTRRTGWRWLPLMTAGAMLALGAACGATNPPPELQNARSALARANANEAAQLNPTDVHVAQAALGRAEASFEEDGASAHTKALAYTATRRAEIAEARARAIAAEREREALLARIESERAARLERTETALSETQRRLEGAREARDAEAQRRAEAERRAKEASQALTKVASVKQETRGMVITLSGAVLFATDEAELLPAARARLAEVAKALSEQDKTSRIVVEGHTDSQGSDEYNQRLSQRRAESVRSFLVGHGIAGDRIVAEGRGESSPIANNDSPEGRANNRRVEIVVEPATSGASSTPD